MHFYSYWLLAIIRVISQHKYILQSLPCSCLPCFTNGSFCKYIFASYELSYAKRSTIRSSNQRKILGGRRSKTFGLGCHGQDWRWSSWSFGSLPCWWVRHLLSNGYLLRYPHQTQVQFAQIGHFGFDEMSHSCIIGFGEHLMAIKVHNWSLSREGSGILDSIFQPLLPIGFWSMCWW
jgi:hypothetical protein